MSRLSQPRCFGADVGWAVAPSSGRDEFERIKLHQDIERARVIIDQYHTGTTFYRREIEERSNKLGRLDERLGGESP